MATRYLPTADGHRNDARAQTPTATVVASAPTTAASTPGVAQDEKAKASVPSAPVTQPQGTKQKKKRTSAYRRRLRRRGQKEEATLTRLAAVLGQIKEACTDEEVGNKIAPLIESATRMIEALSENQKKGPDGGKKGKEGGSSDDTAGTDNNTGKINPERVRSVVAPGARIPPHVYRPIAAARWQPAQKVGYRPVAAPGKSSRIPIMSVATVNKEAVQRDLLKLELRDQLRKSRTVDDVQAALAEAETLGLRHEAEAARSYLNKLKMQQAVGTTATN